MVGVGRAFCLYCKRSISAGMCAWGNDLFVFLGSFQFVGPLGECSQVLCSLWLLLLVSLGLDAQRLQRLGARGLHEAPLRVNPRGRLYRRPNGAQLLLSYWLGELGGFGILRTALRQVGLCSAQADPWRGEARGNLVIL